jgi:hypothetical protein
MPKELARIREYTRKHPELREAHHFLFDLPLTRESANVKFLVFGLNPGESDHDWRIASSPTEESREFDFHERSGNPSPGREKWPKNCRFFLGTSNVVFSEFFFWSSKDSDKQFRQRFGPIGQSPHLGFCSELNMRLIDHHQPKAIVCPGLPSPSYTKLVLSLYRLRFADTLRSDRGHRLVERYHDGVRPWLFTKHWTGARGFSNVQREAVREYIAKHTN